jgi:hypothetical protein
VRRVPKTFADLDKRGTIRTSLKTSSTEVAQSRRDALAEADDQYWATLAASLPDLGGEPSLSATARARYQGARHRAMAKGFIYTPLEQLVTANPLDELQTHRNTNSVIILKSTK